MKEFYKRVLISMLDVTKTGARVSARQPFCRHIVRDSLRSWLGKKPLPEAGNVRASVKTARVSVKTCGFSSYLIRDSSRQCKRTARARDVLALGLCQ